ncbi:RHS repeat domain-containing protein [Phaeodactylibacter xiamenensis]|uniref:RHS repeat domain-containing protein n=1 Tax=Phaeodactylibacter xiamenensis TaxID=1524460 RepID=UPI003BAD0BA9
MDRLTDARFAEYDYAQECPEYLNYGRYDVNIEYDDHRGNISSIDRNGLISGATNFGAIDQITLVNEKNRIKFATENSLQNKGFKGSSGQMGYDNNGNLTNDPSRGITTTYNRLNLPEQITVNNSSFSGTLTFTYDYDGNLLKRVVSQSSPSALSVTTEYAGGIEYVNGTLQSIYHEEGRYVKNGSNWYHEYVIRDHLGNNRVFFSDTNGNGFISMSEVSQEAHYYPFGMAMQGSWLSTSMPKNKYRYNGIEQTSNLGLDVYNAFYRTLDPSLGRWWQVDPKAESAYSHTPYNSMFNNPIAMSDPEGDLPGIAEIAGLSNGLRNLFQGESFFEGFAQGWTQSWEITGGLFQYSNDLSFGQNLWNTFSKLTWELPQTLVGLTVAQGLNIGTAVNDVNYFRGATVLDTDLDGGAFAAGSYLIGPEGFGPNFEDHLFVHEFGHYLQSKRLGPLYLNFVALPSVAGFWAVDEVFNQNLNETRWYEAQASRLAANYFDQEFGSGLDTYFPNSPNHFDRNSFINRGLRSPYPNPRGNNVFGRGNPGGNPINSRFHWTDIPISLIFNGGLGLFGYL